MSRASLLSTSLRRLLCLAALLHVLVAVSIAIIGKNQLLPHTFDQNGVGISFAVDSLTYRTEALTLTQLLDEGRFSDWWHRTAQFTTPHVRLYSFCFATFGKLLGHGILAIEPVNLIYYLSILILVYLAGAIAFSAHVGRTAAITVALWPSFLMHTTQLLRDPPFIACFLLLVVCVLSFICRRLTIRRLLICTAVSLTSLILIMLVRSSMWEVVVSALIVGAIVSVVDQIRGRRFIPGKSIALLALVVCAFVMPQVIPNTRISDRFGRPTARLRVERLIPNPGFIGQVGWLRQKFSEGYRAAGSNLDTDVKLNGLTDLILYLPRAIEIGFLAPFPNMWIMRGAQVGVVGHLIAGAEMLVMYLLLGLVGVALVYDRRQPPVWLLFMTAAIGCIALAYIVVNISALYRLRYSSFILLIVLAARGLQILQERKHARVSPANEREMLPDELALP